jgi:hypothetical protein
MTEKVKNFCLLQSLQTGSGTHPNSHSVLLVVISPRIRGRGLKLASYRHLELVWNYTTLLYVMCLYERLIIRNNLLLYGLYIILQCMCSRTDTQYSCITEFIHESVCSTMFRTSRVHPQERLSCVCGFGKW